jgi:predicted nucleic acid-binding protein
MLVLVDTSVWVQHFRRAVPKLVALLTDGEVVAHSVVVGELAVGGLRNRLQTLADLRALPLVAEVGSTDTLDFVERRRLFNIGLSWGDVQLLAAAELNRIPLWTFDATVHLQAQALQLAWPP